MTITVFPNRYIQGKGVINNLGKEISRFGKSGFVICTSYAFNNILPKSKAEIERSVRVTAEKFGGESSDAEINRLTEIARGAECDVVIGLGGGKSLDTARAVAHNLRAPVAMVPTIASTDAPCSAVAGIYSPSGTFERVLFLPKNPDLVLVDTEIIANAPVRFLVSGMGDALATWFEAESCRVSGAKNVAGGRGSMTAYALARLCYDTILKYGVSAVKACERKTVTPELENVIEANTLLSGIGFESGGLAAAHSIHNGFTVLERARGSYHGEKVAFGTLASLFLTNKTRETVDEVYAFCESVGLPTRLADLGFTNLSDGDLKRVAEKTCVKGENIHNEPQEITPDMVCKAIKAADDEGERRKK
jgi:glycerol dehydrogenase